MKELSRVSELALNAARVLDVGGWYQPLNVATHVLDINGYETRRKTAALDPEQPERFDAATWTCLDICDRKPWPYPDKYFDFSVCSHTLEDIRDPIWVISELARVSKSGYLETPSEQAEILMTKYGRVGSLHHRWFVRYKPEEGLVEFRMKPHDLFAEGRFIWVTKLHAVDHERTTDSMFWKGSVTGKEMIFGIREHLDALIPAARKIIRFAPLFKIKRRLLRTRKVRLKPMPDRLPYL